MVSLLLALRFAVAPVPVDTGHLDAGNGIHLYYHVLGGPHRDTVVFVHGGPGLSSAYLQKDLDFIAERHTVVLYDQRGSGRSTLIVDSSKVSVGLHVADLHAVLAHFRIAQAYLYGHSWGAGLVAHYVAAHPTRVRKAILGSSIPPRRDPYGAQFSNNLLAWADSATTARIAALARARRGAADPVQACRAYWEVFLRGYFADPAAVPQMLSDVCADPAASLGNRVNAWTRGPEGPWDWRSLLAQTTVPIAVVHGSGDPIPLAAAREWAASIPGSRLIVLEGSGHFTMVERPRAMLDALEGFLFSPPGSRR
jgi:proline iminopeptidase